MAQIAPDVIASVERFLAVVRQRLRVDAVPARRELNGDKARRVMLHRRETPQSAMNQHRANIGMDFEQFGYARRQLDNRFARELLGPGA